MGQIAIQPAVPEDGAAIAALYAEAGYGAAVRPDDTVIVAKAGVELVGVVRLCAEEGVIVLRGMQLTPAWQRQGIGARLLAACAARLQGKAAWCLPYSHLDTFYGAAGFVRVDGAALPPFLARRLAAYRAGGQDVVAMWRPAA